MREIKFRGKRIDNGKWIYGYLHMEEEEGECPVNIPGGGHGKQYGVFTNLAIQTVDDVITGSYYVSCKTVGQYAGQKDKNGVEIYEGDIFKTRTDVLAVVEWDEKNSRFLGWTLERERKIVYVGKEPAVEVIGNIYENHELLEATP